MIHKTMVIYTHYNLASKQIYLLARQFTSNYNKISLIFNFKCVNFFSELNFKRRKKYSMFKVIFISFFVMKILHDNNLLQLLFLLEVLRSSKHLECYYLKIYKHSESYYT